jgi:hypothetical protein
MDLCEDKCEDKCMTKPNGYVVRDLHIILGLYVDNYIIIGNNIKFLEHIKVILSSNLNLTLLM